MISKLEAVNHLLRTIHESPVNSLETDLPDEAGRALETLDEVSHEVQLRGWKFNTERDVTLQKTVDGFVFLPANAVRAVLNEKYTRPDLDLTIRGNQVYNRKTRTYVITENVLMDRLVYELEWDDLPDTARLYIKHKAARVYASREIVSPTSAQNATVEEIGAWNELKREQFDGEKPNMLSAPDTAQIAGRGVLRAYGF